MTVQIDLVFTWEDKREALKERCRKDLFYIMDTYLDFFCSWLGIVVNFHCDMSHHSHWDCDDTIQLYLWSCDWELGNILQIRRKKNITKSLHESSSAKYASQKNLSKLVTVITWEFQVPHIYKVTAFKKET